MTLRSRETGVASVGVAIMLLAAIVLVPRHAAVEGPSAEVTRATFADTIVESGTVGAQRLMIYGSRIAGAQAKIAEIVPEGTAVRAGDLLVRFDASGFEQSRLREEASVRQAQADLVRAREDLRLETLRAAGEFDAARQEVGHAERGLVNQLEGKGKLEVAEADLAAAEAAREERRAKSAYEDLKPLLAEGFVTRTELDRAEQAWTRATEQLRLAEFRRETLVTYERPAATSRAESGVQTARDALARERESIAARRGQRDAAVAAAASHLEEVRARVAILDAQIAASIVRAGGPGLVVYRELYFGTDKRKPQVGDEVFPNQPLIAVPDLTQLTVETRIREVDLHKVSASQRVTVTVDAYPSLRLSASVQLVGALAQEDAARAGTKFFPVTVKLIESDPRLRTGMTAQVAIDVAVLPHALVVPLQAVFDDHGTNFVLLARGGRAERRTVSVLGTNELVAALDGGVTAGDRVWLVDPSRP